MNTEYINFVDKNDPILYEEVQPFDFVNPPEDPVEFSRNLIHCMYESNGMGLAANQIGITYRVFAVGNPRWKDGLFDSDEDIGQEEYIDRLIDQSFANEDPEKPIVPFVMFNPKIVDYSEETLYYEEGCLTYPGLFIKIKRPAHCRVRFADPHGKVNTVQFGGVTARIIQHEYDHLEGVKFIDRASQLEKDRARRKHKQWLRKQKHGRT